MCRFVLSRKYMLLCCFEIFAVLGVQIYYCLFLCLFVSNRIYYLFLDFYLFSYLPQEYYLASWCIVSVSKGEGALKEPFSICFHWLWKIPLGERSINISILPFFCLLYVLPYEMHSILTNKINFEKRWLDMLLAAAGLLSGK